MTDDKKQGKELFGVYLYPHERDWINKESDKDQRTASEWARLVLITKMPQE